MTMYVLLRNTSQDTWKLKPYHIEEEERFLRFPPHPQWKLVGKFETFMEAYSHAFGVTAAQMLVGNGKRDVSPRLRYKIFKRDGYKCQVCGAGARNGAILEVDHRVPISKGGSNHPTNLWTLCSTCNSGKGDLSY